MDTQSQKKPRFLCLHGFRTSAEILRKQLRRWPETVLGKLDLVVMDGPYAAQGKSDVEGFYDPPCYEWFQFRQDFQEYYNSKECIAYIEDYMIKHGPFDGLMGFSQVGSYHISSIARNAIGWGGTYKSSKDWETVQVWQVWQEYLIIISGGKFGGCMFGSPKLSANTFSSPIKCPSLHIIGEEDFLKEPGIELLESFVEPFLINHPKGHTIARLDEKGLKTMFSFIEKIEKM